jgi:fluoride exporter
MKHLLFIALGGAGGALARHGLSTLVHSLGGSHFPLGTLTVNVLGSLLIGVMYVLIVESGLLHPDWRTIFIVGFLGAFTTFSTFSLETVTLLESGQSGMALIYIVSSLAVCIGGVWASMILTRLLVTG